MTVHNTLSNERNSVKMMKKNWLISHLPALIAGLFILQPVLDVCSFWVNRFDLPGSITLLLRLGVLCLTILTAYILSDRKRVYWIAAGICALIFAGHVWACMQVGYQDIMGDLTNYIRIIQMPLTVLCLITFMRCNDRGFEGMQFGLTGALLVMLSVMILSVVTGTDPHTYADGFGNLGWFYFANCQSNNLTILVPISLGWQLCWKKRNPFMFWATAVLGLFSLYFLCTRLAYLGIAAATVGLCFTILLVRRRDWKIAAGLAALCLLFACLLPVSPMYRRTSNDEAYQDIRQGWISSDVGNNQEELQTLVQQKKTHSESITPNEQQFLIDTLTPIYEKYVGDFVEIFGIEPTMEMYGYTTDVRTFSAMRAKKLMFAKLLMDGDPLSSKLFGLELSRFTVGEHTYDVENDFHGMYYLYGWVGLGACLLFIAYFVYLIIWALVKNAKRYYTVEAASYGIAFLMCMAHVYNTAGVLRRPNGSIYLSAILAGIYYLVKLRSYPEKESTDIL